MLALAVFMLALRLVVPAGFMPVAHGGWATIAVCTGHGPATMRWDGAPAKPVKAPPSCGFDLLAAPALDAAGPLWLIAAPAAFAAVALILSTTQLARRLPWLRPPLRGPPALPV